MRQDKIPDPYAKHPTPLERNPGRSQPKQVTVDSTRPVPRMRAHVHSSVATQSINSATPTVISFNTVDYDTVGLFASNKFTMPVTGKVTGAWLLHGHSQYVKAAGGTVRELYIRKNGTTTIAYSVTEPNILNSLDALVIINDPNPGDFFELIANQDSGGAINLTTTAEKTYFELIHLW